VPKPKIGYDSIVVATDGSSRAQVAFQHALSLAKLTGAKRFVLGSVPNPGSTDR